MKYDIDAINTRVDQIGSLHNNALASFNEQQSKQTARELEKIKTETQQKNTMIKNQIQGGFKQCLLFTWNQIFSHIFYAV